MVTVDAYIQKLGDMSVEKGTIEGRQRDISSDFENNSYILDAPYPLGGQMMDIQPHIKDIVY
jgi:hypothetical protein